jgi:hypothetical protein
MTSLRERAVAYFLDLQDRIVSNLEEMDGRRFREDRSEREMYTQVYHWDGNAWTLVDSPPALNVVAAVAPGQAWAVGRAGTVARWDGKAWQAAKIPGVDFDLLDIAADGSHVWIAASGPELYQYDGAAWNKVSPEPLAKHRVQKIILADGQLLAPATWQGEAAVVRFAGGAWRREVAGEGGLIRLAASGADDVWGFGHGGKAYHHDGQAWRPVALDDDDGPIDAWAAAKDDAWLVGDAGMVQRWDGKAWKRLSSGGKDKLWAVWSAPGGPVFVGGDGGLFRLKPASN